MNKKEYKAPKIIYEGRITTRAGSPASNFQDEVDPAQLFGNTQ